MTADIDVRWASDVDIGPVAELFLSTIDTMPFLPRLYTNDEERAFIRNVIFPECQVFVAETKDEIRGFLALEDRLIRLLFIHPDAQGVGVGSALLNATKALDKEHLDLWCFEANHAARRFYERKGFEAVERTDGTRNEEKLPDIRYRWVR